MVLQGQKIEVFLLSGLSSRQMFLTVKKKKKAAQAKMEMEGGCCRQRAPQGRGQVEGAARRPLAKTAEF